LIWHSFDTDYFSVFICYFNNSFLRSMHGLKKAKKYMNLRARTPPKHRADERQQQLLQRVGVAKRTPGEF